MLKEDESDCLIYFGVAGHHLSVNGALHRNQNLTYRDHNGFIFTSQRNFVLYKVRFSSVSSGLRV
jgi:hypothetical protein